MITEVIETVRSTLQAEIESQGGLIDVVKYDGFARTDKGLSNKLLAAVRFLGVEPSGFEPGTGETMGSVNLGILIRQRLDEDSYNNVVDTAEYIAAWLKWRRFEHPLVSARGAQMQRVRSASQEFGMPVLEVLFSLRKILSGRVPSIYPEETLVSNLNELNIEGLSIRDEIRISP